MLQAYDFLELSRRHDCRLQMGGRDQWGNIVAGVDLIRRVDQKAAFGITFPLITTSSGEKMGKTAKGAVWLDAARTSPYEYYQYWINTDDRDVARFLALFTFLPLEEIRAVERLEGSALNAAKTVLAFEATGLAHGREEALAALQASPAPFRQPRNFGQGSTVEPHPACVRPKRIRLGVPSSTIPAGTVGGWDSGVQAVSRTGPEPPGPQRAGSSTRGGATSMEGVLIRLSG